MHSSGHKYHYLINVEDPQMALGYLATCLPNNKEHRAVAACRSCSFTILQTRLSFLNQRSCTITYIDQSQTNFSVMNQEFIQFSERQNQNDQQSILILTYIFHIYGHQAIKANQASGQIALKSFIQLPPCYPHENGNGRTFHVLQVKGLDAITVKRKPNQH